MMKRLLIKLRRGKSVKIILWLFFKLFSILPTKKNLIIFESFLGKQYSDNPKSIYIYMKKNNPEYEMYWSIDRRVKNNFNTQDIAVLPRFGLKWIYMMARAEYWVTNSRLPLWLPKRKGTNYVQTWHGTPLKKLAMDMDEVHMPGTKTSVYKENFIREVRKWDYLISPNKYSTNIFRRAFQFNKDIVESGYPRNDILSSTITGDKLDEVKSNIGIPQDKKVILYAPTWRDDEYFDVGKYKFSLQMDLNKMQQSLGKDYVVLLRLHYLVANKIELDQYKGFVYNVSDYKDISELYLISDILITDYSSVFFDYAILKRPIIFFVYDIDTYRDKLRGFYFDFENFAPGPLKKDTEGLIDEILKFEDDNYIVCDKKKEFIDTYCYLEDGFATKRVVEAIFTQG